MSQNNLKPQYLKSSPIGKDQLEGKSHQKIANTIHDLIIEQSLPNNVVGLEGEWGSGKSNIISILESELEKGESDYFFFTYDAWGHQEDLTRKTFLEELISQLRVKEKFKGNIDWEHELKKLLARKTKTNTAIYPKVKFFWIVIMASVLLFSFLSAIYTDFFDGKDLIPCKTFPHFVKPIVLKYLAPAIVFIYGIREFFREFNDFDNDEETENLNWKERCKRLLYIFSGNDLESEELEHTIEEEPSVKSFKDYFKKIRNDLESEGLVIVFDNMDRLSDSNKVLSLWSSIHTFFAEEEAENIWVVIPYDKQHLASHFNDGDDKESKLENFIGKTFSTIFRVSPPVLSDWKKFFITKMNEAFKDVIKNEEIEFIASLYELIINVNNRKPRDIITFINQLTSLYLQHSSNVDVQYLALFILRRNAILNNPLTSISGKGFLNEEKHLFTNSKELESSLASIVYNVDRSKSSEVLLKNNIEDSLIRYDSEIIQNVKQHHDFPTYFDKIFLKVNLSNSKSSTVAEFLEEISDVIPNKSMKRYWEKFSSDIQDKENGSFETFEEWHQKTLLNISKDSAKNLSNRITESTGDKFERSEKIEDESGKQYYEPIFNLLMFLYEKKLKVKPAIRPVQFTPGQLFFYLIEMHQKFDEKVCGYTHLKISAEPNELHNYLTVDNSNIDFWDSWLHIIKYLMENEETFMLDEFIEHVNDVFIKTPYNQKETLGKAFKILKTLSEKSNIQLLPLNTGNRFLNSYRNDISEPYFDVICTQIAHLGTSSTPSNGYLIAELNRLDNANEIAENIQYFSSFGNILKLAIITSNRKYPLFSEIGRKLCENDYEFSQKLDIRWVFENIKDIENVVFQDDIKVFLTEFDSWSDNFENKVNSENIFDLGQGFVDLSSDLENHKFKCVNYFYKKAIEKFRLFSKKDWLENFDTNSSAFITLKKYVTTDLLDKSITKSDKFMDAYESYMKDIARREKPIADNIDIWRIIENGGFLHGSKQTRLFNDFIDLVLEHTELRVEEVEFFGKGFLRYSSNLKKNPNKANEFLRKIIIPLKNNPEVFHDLLENSKEELVAVINTADDYKQDLVELIVDLRNQEALSEKSSEELLNSAGLTELAKGIEKKKEE
jgi:hypothetical protein